MNFRYLILLTILISSVMAVSADPVADFTANRTHILPGQSVLFTDTSTGGPDTWWWDIEGEGTHPTTQNTSYTFATEGVYTIRLEVRLGAGPVSSATKTDYITVYPTYYNYSTPGTYTWQAPIGIDVTSITMDIGAGGGSGRGCFDSGSVCQAGYGGTSGESQRYSSITVGEGLNYTIVVPAGGAASPATVTYTDAGNAGGDATAFGYTKHGGAGALGGSPGDANGGNAIGTGFITTAFLAQNGTSSTTRTGGIAATGYSGGGGGGAAGDVSHRSQAGGAGANGTVRIYLHGYSGGNVPDFVGSPTSGGSGTLVTFTDTSILSDPADLSYNWSFGDGDYSSTIGNVIHVYPYLGSYTVSLSITSTNGTVTETKEAYINLVNQQGYILPTQPKSVRFKIVDAYGNDLPGATVTANYLNNSLPSNDVNFLVSAFGVPVAVAQTMTDSGIAMQGRTSTDGSLSFVMYPVLQYGITITNSTAGLSKYVTVFPQDNDYIIKCELPSQTSHPTVVENLTQSAIYISEPNASVVFVNLSFIDATGSTNGLTWNITYANNGTTLYTNDYGDPGTTLHDASHSISTAVRGQEYVARYFAHQESGETVIVGASIMTKGTMGILIPLGIENWVSATQAYYLYNLIAVSIIIFIAAMSGPRSEAAFTIVVPIFASLLMYFGWLRLSTPAQTQGLFYLVVIMGVFGVIMYMNDQNRQTYGSGAPGSKLFTIAIFLALFGASMSLVSGFTIPGLEATATQPIPGTCATGFSCDQFNNLDFSTTQNSLTNASGLDLGSSIGWMLDNGLKMGIVLVHVLVGVFAFPVILNATMNGIAPGITSNAAWLLFLGILELVVLYIYVISAYEFFTKAPAGSTL